LFYGHQIYQERDSENWLKFFFSARREFIDGILILIRFTVGFEEFSSGDCFFNFLAWIKLNSFFVDVIHPN